MINWILEQQEILTLTLLVIWLSDLLLAKRAGSNFTYRLYALIPLALIAFNLPSIDFSSSAPVTKAALLHPETIATTLHTITTYQVTPNFAQKSTNQIQWVWLVGVFILLTIVITGFIKIARLPKSVVLLDHLYDRLPNGVFYTSNKIKGPILKGIFKPEIILPSNYKQCYDAAQLDYVIEHELVHAKRFDNLWNLFALIFLILFWFNPVVWAVYLRFRLTQECACDEKVLVLADKDKKISYSRAMLQSYEHWNKFWILQSHYGDKMTMITRINRLKNNLKPSRLARSLAGGLGAAILSAVFVWGQASAQASSSVDLNNAKVLNLPLPRAAFFEGIQGEVHLQFNVEDGKASSIKTIQTVTSGGHEKEFIEAATKFIKSLPFSGKNGDLIAANYVARFHIAGVGDSKAKLDEVNKRMPNRIIHLLPYSIPSPENEITFSGAPQLQFIKNHYPSYPEGLESIGVSATAIIEFDVGDNGIAVNPRVISVDAPSEYKASFHEVAQKEVRDLFVFRNKSGQQINNVRVELHWNPADYAKGFAPPSS